jgi:hypothetical protein
LNATFGEENRESCGYSASIRANGRKLLHVPTKTVLPGKAKFQVTLLPINTAYLRLLASLEPLVIVYRSTFLYMLLLLQPLSLLMAN